MSKEKNESRKFFWTVTKKLGLYVILCPGTLPPSPSPEKVGDGLSGILGYWLSRSSIAFFTPSGVVRLSMRMS